MESDASNEHMGDTEYREFYGEFEASHFQFEIETDSHQGRPKLIFVIKCLAMRSFIYIQSV